MLLNYKFENFMSFREQVEFSMLAPKTKVKKRFPDNYIVADQGGDVLKTAVIVGENAGGKSNFVRSLEYLKSFFQENKELKAYKGSVNVNNQRGICMKINDTCQMFEIEIVYEDKGFYLYHLEIDFLGIVREELRYKKQYKHKYKQVFTAWREQCVLKCEEDEKFCLEKSKCHTSAMVRYEIRKVESKMREAFLEKVSNQPFIGLIITKLALLGDEHAVNFTKWMMHSLCPETNMINYDIYKTMRNEEEDFKILNDPRYLEIFRMIDTSIVEIMLHEDMPFTKSLIIRRKADGSTFSRELSQDSSGVREYFAWAVEIFKVVYEDKIVFADEMDRVLNPVLSDRVVAFVNGKAHRGQFIFTTHNVLHLDLRNYMKEQIYFISKDVESLESELYSLADFPEIRYETSKIYEFYMKGILGGTVVE